MRLVGTPLLAQELRVGGVGVDRLGVLRVGEIDRREEALFRVTLVPERRLRLRQPLGGERGGRESLHRIDQLRLRIREPLELDQGLRVADDRAQRVRVDLLRRLVATDGLCVAPLVVEDVSLPNQSGDVARVDLERVPRTRCAPRRFARARIGSLRVARRPGPVARSRIGVARRPFSRSVAMSFRAATAAGVVVPLRPGELRAHGEGRTVLGRRRDRFVELRPGGLQVRRHERGLGQPEVSPRPGREQERFLECDRRRGSVARTNFELPAHERDVFLDRVPGVLPLRRIEGRASLVSIPIERGDRRHRDVEVPNVRARLRNLRREPDLRAIRALGLLAEAQLGLELGDRRDRGERTGPRLCRPGSRELIGDRAGVSELVALESVVELLEGVRRRLRVLVLVGRVGDCVVAEGAVRGERQRRSADDSGAEEDREDLRQRRRAFPLLGLALTTRARRSVDHRFPRPSEGLSRRGLVLRELAELRDAGDLSVRGHRGGWITLPSDASPKSFPLKPEDSAPPRSSSPNDIPPATLPTMRAPALAPRRRARGEAGGNVLGRHRELELTEAAVLAPLRLRRGRDRRERVFVEERAAGLGTRGRRPASRRRLPLPRRRRRRERIVRRARKLELAEIVGAPERGGERVEAPSTEGRRDGGELPTRLLDRGERIRDRWESVGDGRERIGDGREGARDGRERGRDGGERARDGRERARDRRKVVRDDGEIDLAEADASIRALDGRSNAGRGSGEGPPSRSRRFVVAGSPTLAGEGRCRVPRPRPEDARRRARGDRRSARTPSSV